MTDSITTDIHQLVQEGRAAANAGDMITARERFRRATEIDSTNAEGWLGLSTAVPVLAEKRQYIQRALELDPANGEARASLAYVDKLIADGYQIAPSKRREERYSSGDASPLLSSPATDSPIVAIEYCYRHPNRETGLHCTNCNRPICAECATPTSVGQICPECRKLRRPVNYQVSPRDVILGGIVGFFASALVALPLGLFLGGFGFFSWIILFMAGPAIAEFIVRVVDRVTKLKRGRGMQITVGIAIALGTLLFIWLNPLFLGLYMILGISTAVTRLR
jgi:hypothetical protein